MLLFASLMGLVAVGSTALVGLEIALEPSDDDDPDQMPETCQPATDDLGGLEFMLDCAMKDEEDTPDQMQADPDDDEAAPLEMLTQLHQEEFPDFSPENHKLVIVYDDHSDPSPVLGLEPDPQDEERTHVTLNGIRIAAVNTQGELTLDHIELVSESMVENTAA